MRFSLPDSEEVLLLTPRWGDADGSVAFWGLLVALLLVGGLLVWLFRWEARLIRRSSAVILLTLRILSVGVLAFVACFEPRLVREYTETTKGRVLVALDVSGSMSLLDPARPLDQLLLARALKLHEKHPALTEEVLSTWIRHLERRGEIPSLQWVLSEESHLGNAEQDRLTRERQSAWTRLRAEVSALCRVDVGRRLLAKEGADLLTKLEKDHEVSTLFFSDGPELSLPDGKPDRGKASDLQLPLDRALRSHREGTTPLLGVVLLSDGKHNLGESPLPLSLRLGRSGVPVYTIPLGSDDSHQDVALLSAKAPASVLRGQDFSLQVQVQASRVPPQDLLVEVFRKGEKKPLVEPRKVAHKGNDREGKPALYSLTIPLKIEEAGTHALDVKVHLSKPVEKEFITENNEHPAVVRIVQQKPRVLLVDGEARWEYHYLSSFLVRDPNLEVERVLFHQPRLDLQPEEKLKKIGFASRALPAPTNEKNGDDPLFAFDCILLGDVSPDDLPLKDQLRLQRYVSERGGTLVLLSGKRHVPFSFASRAESPLSSLFPVTDLRVEPTKTRGFGMVLSETGKTTPWLTLHENPVQSLKAWSELPRHYWGVTGKARPGAVVLAQAEPEDAKAKRETERGLMVLQNVGLGRVLWLGLESTWRFRRFVGDTHHHRFWGQLVLWAGTKDLLPAGNQHVRFGSRQPVYGPEQDADLAVRLGSKIELAPGKDPVRMKLFRLDGGKEESLGEVVLEPAEGQPRLFQGKASKLRPGKYRVEPVLAKHEKEIKDALGEKEGDPTFTVLPSISKEMLDPAPDHDLLRSLSRESGGKMIRPANVEDLVQALESRVERKEQRLEKRLWSDEPYIWWLFALISGFLTLEWLGRKWVGLP